MQNVIRSFVIIIATIVVLGVSTGTVKATLPVFITQGTNPMVGPIYSTLGVGLQASLPNDPVVQQEAAKYGVAWSWSGSPSPLATSPSNTQSTSFSGTFLQAGTINGTASVSASITDNNGKQLWSDTGAITVAFTAVQVKITTSGPLEIDQDPSAVSVDISAQIVPSDRSINWSISGPGADFVTYISNGGTCTVKLKIPISRNWTGPSSITVTAADSQLTACSDQIGVRLVKFSRESFTSPGDDPVNIWLPETSLPTQSTVYSAVATDDGLGEDLHQISVGLHTSEVSTNGDGSSHGATVGHWSDTATSTTQPTSESGSVVYFYQSQGDKCEGFASVDDKLTYVGNIGVEAFYYEDNDQYNPFDFDYQASFTQAAGVSAQVDNDNVNLSNPTVATGYQGTVTTVTLNLGYQGGSGGGPTGGVSVPVRLTWNQTAEIDGGGPVGGQYIMKVDMQPHQAGQQFTMHKYLRLNSAFDVNQVTDDEWGFSSDAELKAEMPDDSEIVFTAKL